MRPASHFFHFFFQSFPLFLPFLTFFTLELGVAPRFYPTSTRRLPDFSNTDIRITILSPHTPRSRALPSPIFPTLPSSWGSLQPLTRLHSLPNPIPRYKKHKSQDSKVDFFPHTNAAGEYFRGRRKTALIQFAPNLERKKKRKRKIHYLHRHNHYRRCRCCCRCRCRCRCRRCCCRS